MNVSHLNTQAVNDVANLSEESDTKGFDLQAGQSWIYPTNYPVRDYQYNIVEKSLLKNTLVSLPTGLGKTFIAAVVMYNFYRWYPHDKIIFMAPTRPLVKQQMDACYNIMAIPNEVTAELTGSKVQQSRRDIWDSKRVFFITPQVLQNDLAIIVELGAKIKCLVFDEAHRARGNHAYCEVIRRLFEKNKLFRVLALSATPGNSARDVIDVMRSLLIAHVEFRSEESDDVKRYVFERSLETVVVPLGEKLQQIKDQYLQILEKYTRNLIQYKVIYGNCANLTKGKIFMVMKDFQAKHSGARTPNYNEIMKSLNICVTLYHAYETLVRCGLRAFLNFYEEHINNPLLRGNMALHQILDNLRQFLGENPQIQTLPNGSFVPISSQTKFGHPKFYKLQEILQRHFKETVNTRVIVFFEYRESASEAYALLTQSGPLIKARVFVGQGSGVTQKDQINTVKAFREGTCNTLLSTCIGEEGLDVGEVDLIICFDIANKSPIRMIQRMGRTGRKKEGRVVILVTEGKEQQTLKECLIYKNNLGNFVSNSEQLKDGIYKENPRMVPNWIDPKCQKMHITVKKILPTLKGGNLKNMLKRMASSEIQFDHDLEIIEIEERLKTKMEMLWNKQNPMHFDFEVPKINFQRHLEKQRKHQDGGFIKPSKSNEIFVSLMQFADSKRFNIPVVQKITKTNDQNKILKQSDIRNMFNKALSQELPQTQINFEKDVTQSYPSELFAEISSFLQISESKSCKTCKYLFECPQIDFFQKKTIDLSSWVQPDLEIVNNITMEDLIMFSDSLSPNSKTDLLLDNDDLFDNISQIENLDFGTPKRKSPIREKSFAFETPNNFKNLLNLIGVPRKQESVEDILIFFKLEALSDIFTQDDVFMTYTPEKENIRETSPDLFASYDEGTPSPIIIEEVESPILSTFDRSQKLQAKKQLFSRNRSPEVAKSPNLGKLKTVKITRSKSPVKSNLDIGDLCDLTSFGLKQNVAQTERKKAELSIDDFCDMSGFFGKTVEKESKHITLNDFCNVSAFLNETVTSKKEIKNITFDGTPHAEEIKSPGLADTKTAEEDYFDFSQRQNESGKIKATFDLEAEKDSLDDLFTSNDFFGTSQQEKSNSVQNEENSKSVEAKPDNKKVSNESRNLVREELELDDFCDLSGFLTTKSPVKTQTQLTVTQILSQINRKDVTSTPTVKKSPRLNLSTKKNFGRSETLSSINVTPKSAKMERKKVAALSSPTLTPIRPNLGAAIITIDSDDDFQQSPVFAKPRAVMKNEKTKKKKLYNEFLDAEADVSATDSILISDDEESEDDCFEASFVHDSQQFLNTTDVHAKYLQSVKSPTVSRGKFKIPETFKHNISNVFSQEVANVDNSYMNDTFCVDDEQPCSQSNDLSELDMLEKKLKEMKRKKKRKKSDEKSNKRRRIIVLSDDSD